MAMPEEFHELARAVNNWGRWGSADERGTLNLLTPEAVRAGAALARHGRLFPLALPLSANGPQTGMVPGRLNPLRTMLSVNEPLTGDPADVSFSDDIVIMGLQAATHWDALAHATYAGRLYNGFPTSTVTAAGARRCGADKIGAVAGRGILLDVARARGVDRLPAGHAITADDLDAAADLAGTTVTPGDILLVRTGHIQLLHAGDRNGYTYPSPGMSLGTVRWLRARDVAAVAIDTLTFEVFPCERPDLLLPVHLLHLVEMGLLQGQNFDLEALAADCAADCEYTFLLSATPEPFTGALGAPVAPVAVK
ncbi:cyclase family protein [Parafrankia sp. EUN1f]|uniref:cyclase family protein n=1 Tax=Parafrankia sp. EUN1f TaxID=102897 RepID=UPI0001C455AB|nr:cyclase family protein [Parafrankia sp. EUN1f]